MQPRRGHSLVFLPALSGILLPFLPHFRWSGHILHAFLSNTSSALLSCFVRSLEQLRHSSDLVFLFERRAALEARRGTRRDVNVVGFIGQTHHPSQCQRLNLERNRLYLLLISLVQDRKLLCIPVGAFLIKLFPFFQTCTHGLCSLVRRRHCR